MRIKKATVPNNIAIADQLIEINWKVLWAEDIVRIGNFEVYVWNTVDSNVNVVMRVISVEVRPMKRASNFICPDKEVKELKPA